MNRSRFQMPSGKVFYRFKEADEVEDNKYYIF